MVRKLLLRVLAPVVAVLTSMGGLAYAGALPDPVREAVADAADVIGLDLHGGDVDGDDAALVEGTDDDQGEDESDAVLDDDQGEDESDAADDDQGEDSDLDDQGDDESDAADDDQGEDSDLDDEADDAADDDQGDDSQN